MKKLGDIKQDIFQKKKAVMIGDEFQSGTVEENGCGRRCAVVKAGAGSIGCPVAQRTVTNTMKDGETGPLQAACFQATVLVSCGP